MKQPPRANHTRGTLAAGHTYRITEIRARLRQLGNIARWIPVLGPFHNDRETIGFPIRHWHIDYRFITEPLARAMEEGRRQTERYQRLHPAFNLVITTVYPV